MSVKINNFFNYIFKHIKDIHTLYIYIEMENIQNFIPTLIEKGCSIQAFNLSCLYKDICLQNYKYNPKFFSCNIIHEWKHYNNEESLNVDRIRQILNHDLKELLMETQNQYLSESQLNDETSVNEEIQTKIKKIAEIIIWMQSNEGILFKEFIDNYRLGYFN